MATDGAKHHGGDESIRLLEVTHPLREGMIRAAVAALRLPAGQPGAHLPLLRAGGKRALPVV